MNKKEAQHLKDVQDIVDDGHQVEVVYKRLVDMVKELQLSTGQKRRLEDKFDWMADRFDRLLRCVEKLTYMHEAAERAQEARQQIQHAQEKAERDERLRQEQEKKEAESMTDNTTVGIELCEQH